MYYTVWRGTDPTVGPFLLGDTVCPADRPHGRSIFAGSLSSGPTPQVCPLFFGPPTHNEESNNAPDNPPKSTADTPYPEPCTLYPGAPPPTCRIFPESVGNSQIQIRQLPTDSDTFEERFFKTTTKPGGLNIMESDPQPESHELSDRQLAVLPYLVSSPSVSEAAAAPAPGEPTSIARPFINGCTTLNFARSWQGRTESKRVTI